MKKIRLVLIAAAAGSLVAVPQIGHAGGSYGGSFGGYGSSGGYAGYASSGGGYAASYAGYGSSGGAGSSGGYASAYAGYGSSGGYSAGSASSGGAAANRVGPLKRLMAGIRAHKAAKHAARAGGSSGGYASYGGSSGGYASYGGSSGGSASYAGYASSGGGYSAASYASSGGSSGGYSPIRNTSYSSASSGGSAYSAVSRGGSSGGYSAAYSAPMQTSVPMAPSVGYQSAPLSSGYVAPLSSTSFPAYDGSTIQSSPIDNILDGVSDGVLLNDDAYRSARPAIDDDAALLEVIVPADASVTVNDHETESDGTTRKFMSKGLKVGYVYTYVVKATYDVDGKLMTQTKEVKLRPGSTELVEFDPSNAVQVADPDLLDDSNGLEESDADADDSVDSDDLAISQGVTTVVRLSVPVDATVKLAGTPTKGDGPVRTFRTKQLAAGEQWTDYIVEVTSTVDGRAVTKHRTITVKAGSVNDLKFDFDDQALAMN